MCGWLNHDFSLVDLVDLVDLHIFDACPTPTILLGPDRPGSSRVSAEVWT